MLYKVRSRRLLSKRHGRCPSEDALRRRRSSRNTNIPLLFLTFNTAATVSCPFKSSPASQCPIPSSQLRPSSRARTSRRVVLLPHHPVLAPRPCHCGQLPNLQHRDHERHSIATILHDLGWDLKNVFISTDTRFQVDGEVKATNLNIAAEMLGRDVAPGGLLSQVKWDRVTKVYPRSGQRGVVIEMKCGFCRDEPATTLTTLELRRRLQGGVGGQLLPQT